MARRGLPKVIYSDNALTFKRLCKDIKEVWTALRHQDVQDYVAHNQISWKFSAERAAWWGGFWERMVRSVKSCLRKILGRSSLNFEELTTVVQEVEAAVNSRPLTFMHSEHDEPRALTPAHFLIGKRLTALPSSKDAEALQRRADELSKRWNYRQLLVAQFWKRWMSDYLLQLRSAHHAKPEENNDLKVGDIVIIHEPMRPKTMWKLGRITELHAGRDSHVRSCDLKLASGQILRRPVQLLYSLEVPRCPPAAAAC